MERMIGEIFEFNGEWYQCIEGCYCNDCAFSDDNCDDRERITLREKLTKEETTGLCASKLRNDGKSVIFKKLEKVGEPVKIKGKLFQTYKRATNETIPKWDYDLTLFPNDNGTVAIEIKQNKEAMEEKKPNMKPFDLEAAKAGKPVCTRDGRKARIICFDANGEYPLIALITLDNDADDIKRYTVGGRYYGRSESSHDLMMLPEKKEGWVNIVIGSNGRPHMGRGICAEKRGIYHAVAGDMGAT